MTPSTLIRLLSACLALATSACTTAQTVLVAGASGKTGVPLVKSLQAEGYKVRAMVRDKAKAGEFAPGVEIVEADVTKPETLTAAVAGARYVISAIGASAAKPPNNPEAVDYRGVANLADAAKAAGVKHLVLMSSIGAGDDNPSTPLNRMFGMVLSWKGKGESHLRSSGVPYTIVRPGGLVDCDGGKEALRVGAGDSNLSGRVCRADVALVMMDALRNPEAAGKTVALVGDSKAPANDWRADWKAVARDSAP
ncbi:MAG: SDR family oxidoreductase [Gammaproteobacteria bacterium]|nr:SDR family oxidoreductase [Gammaproteobacteria bacterium]